MINFIHFTCQWFLILWWISDFKYMCKKKKNYLGANTPCKALFLPLDWLWDHSSTNHIWSQSAVTKNKEKRGEQMKRKERRNEWMRSKGKGGGEECKKAVYLVVLVVTGGEKCWNVSPLLYFPLQFITPLPKKPPLKPFVYPNITIGTKVMCSQNIHGEICQIPLKPGKVICGGNLGNNQDSVMSHSFWWWQTADRKCFEKRVGLRVRRERTVDGGKL